jgi:hypothetical protein
VTWNFNNLGGLGPSIAAGGRTASDRLFFFDTVFTSPAYFWDHTTGTYPRRGRWGDYSCVVVDSLDSTRMWGVNEAIRDKDTWITSIFRFRR